MSLSHELNTKLVSIVMSLDDATGLVCEQIDMILKKSPDTAYSVQDLETLFLVTVKLLRSQQSVLHDVSEANMRMVDLVDDTTSHLAKE